MKGVYRKIMLALKRNYVYPSFETKMIGSTETQQIIRELLQSSVPCMIARFGSVELQAVVDSLCKPTLTNASRFVRGQIPAWGYAPSTMRTMHINAGFFPSTPEMLDRFGCLMVECMPLVDILGSWRSEESFVMTYMPQAKRVPLYALEPYYFDNPWTPVLEGKKVLVVHPFEETIRKQHEPGRYEHLFADKRLTPQYELQTLKAVQSIAGNKPAEFDDWFQALDWMKSEIDKRDFDIAIIGCGAYGFPLAAHVKQMGKKAVHLGGAVQNLFGIRSRGMERDPKFDRMMNEYWVRPAENETPAGFQKVENGLYW